MGLSYRGRILSRRIFHRLSTSHQDSIPGSPCGGRSSKLIWLCGSAIHPPIHAHPTQVTAGEALPRLEVQETPYGVLCTTESGGHLGWYQLGGSRWFTKVVCRQLFTHALCSVSFISLTLADVSRFAQPPRPPHTSRNWPEKWISSPSRRLQAMMTLTLRAASPDRSGSR